MKLFQLNEAKYAEDKSPEFSGLTAEQVIKKFFDLNDEVSTPGHSRHFEPKEGLLIQDASGGDIIQWIVFTEAEHYYGHGMWIALDHNTDKEWSVDPSKLIVSQTRILYK